MLRRERGGIFALSLLLAPPAPKRKDKKNDSDTMGVGRAVLLWGQLGSKERKAGVAEGGWAEGPGQVEDEWRPLGVSWALAPLAGCCTAICRDLRGPL